MNLPEQLKYTEDHEWLQLSDDGTTAKIGITDFAQGELGDIVFVELEAVGDLYEQGDVFGTVEAVKAVSELFIPVSATIYQHNPALEDQPELVNTDPYGEGWMIEVELTDPSQVDELLSADAYADLVR
ncbi:MAG: glycine cleavage system protein GcvH [Bacteroidetes bacterium]|nr:glycine cleavage system protein GcvH [Bacteroidota bacterium]